MLKIPISPLLMVKVNFSEEFISNLINIKRENNPKFIFTNDAIPKKNIVLKYSFFFKK